MKEVILYVHGKGGSAAESEHYAPLFPGCEVIGLNYKSFTPWEAGREIRETVEKLCREDGSITLIANSIGATFSMSAGIDALIRKAYLISPIVDMERLIRNMMARANVTEGELQRKGVIPTAFGEDLSWEYLCYVREHPISWNAPTEILYGSADELIDYETVTAFVKAHRAGLTVMDGGEHWFHTPEQMAFLDDWIRRQEAGAEQKILVHGKQYRILRMLSHGKGGYSYLAECERCLVVLKQIHHEPCDYYSFGKWIRSRIGKLFRGCSGRALIMGMTGKRLNARWIMSRMSEGISTKPYAFAPRILPESWYRTALSGFIRTRITPMWSRSARLLLIAEKGSPPRFCRKP